MTYIHSVDSLATEGGLSVDDAAAIAGCSRSTIVRALRSQTLLPRYIEDVGSDPIILRRDLDVWIRNQRAALSVEDAARYVGISRSKLYEVIADGQLSPRRVGARTVLLRTDLDDWLLQLPTTPVRALRVA